MSEGSGVPRVALRWPREAARAMGVFPAELEASGLARHIRRWKVGHVEVVTVAELERVLNPSVEEDES